MSSIRLISAIKGKFKVSAHNMLKGVRSTGYDCVVTFTESDNGGWISSMSIGQDMPVQSTPEEAADRLSLYLLALSKAVKGKNIKHINMDKMFETVHKK